MVESQNINDQHWKQFLTIFIHADVVNIGHVTNL